MIGTHPSTLGIFGGMTDSQMTEIAKSEESEEHRPSWEKTTENFEDVNSLFTHEVLGLAQLSQLQEGAEKMKDKIVAPPLPENRTMALASEDEDNPHEEKDHDMGKNLPEIVPMAPVQNVPRTKSPPKKSSKNDKRKKSDSKKRD